MVIQCERCFGLENACVVVWVGISVLQDWCMTLVTVWELMNWSLSLKRNQSLKLIIFLLFSAIQTWEFWRLGLPVGFSKLAICADNFCFLYLLGAFIWRMLASFQGIWHPFSYVCCNNMDFSKYSCSSLQCIFGNTQFLF